VVVNSIDGAKRRAELAAAVWGLIAQGGLQAASVRGVAQATGLAAGSVRHFFPTQAALHEFAMRALVRTVAERVRTVAETPIPPMAKAQAVLEELLPLTDRTRMEFTAYLEFMVAAKSNPDLRAVATRTVTEVRSAVRRMVGTLDQAGLVALNTDLDSAAANIHAVLDGLFFQLLLVPEIVSPAGAKAILRWSLHSLKG
jgi:AcrR family transcriptional regulator